MASNAKASATSIAKKQPKITPFSDLYKFDDYYSPELAAEAVRMQTERQYQPVIREQLGNVRQGFANRNLFRSGIRAQDEGRTLADLSEQAATTSEQLLEQRRNEALAQFSEAQRQYEKSPKGFNIGTYVQPVNKGYTVQAPTAQNYQATQYGGLGGYLQAYREYMKSQTPGFYTKYYGQIKQGI